MNAAACAQVRVQARVQVQVQEVAPRDGFQIEPAWVPTDAKVAFIDRLSDCGFARIEAGSFVSPKAVPALRDGAEVFARIRRRPGTVYAALVPNLEGARRAIAAGADALNLVLSASPAHNLANMRMSVEASLQAFGEIAAFARDSGVALDGSIATAFGSPFGDAVAEARVLELVAAFRAIGLQGITLADTTGMANPLQVRGLVGRALAVVGADALTLHFHNTRGLGLVNVLAACEAGARRFDAALGGLGGCPTAPGATGNVCTEDLVHLCEAMGIETGIDLDGLIALSRELPGLVGHEVPGLVAKAGRAGTPPPAACVTQAGEASTSEGRAA